MWNPKLPRGKEESPALDITRLQCKKKSDHSFNVACHQLGERKEKKKKNAVKQQHKNKVKNMKSSMQKRCSPSVYQEILRLQG